MGSILVIIEETNKL
jgi:hypothetical protein